MAALRISALLLLVASAGSAGAQTDSHVKFCKQQLPGRFKLDIGKRQLTLGSNHFTTFESPFGELLKDDGTLWSSNQYSLDYWFYHQLTRWPNQTSCEEADIVYVPFLTCMVGEDDAANKAWLELDRDMETLLPYVKTKPHFIVLARTEWISRQFDKKDMGHLLDRQHRYNLTYTTIEVFKPVWQHRAGPRNILSMPHPTFYHFHEGMHPEAFDAEVLTARKKRLAVETFYPRFDFRKRLQAACNKVPHKCLHADFDYWHQNDPNHVSQWMNQTASAWFCLNPTGDMPTRKSTVDCLMAGTIPVVFDHWVPHTFFFGDVINATDVMVFIDQAKLEHDPIVLFDMLDQITIPERLRLLQNIYRWRQVFQFSLTPKGGDIRWDNLRELQPRDDALTFTLKAVVRNMCERKLIPNKCP